MSAANRLDVPIPAADACLACQLWSHRECERRRSPHNSCTCWCTQRLTVASRSPVSAPAPQGPPVAGERNGTVSLLPSAAARPTVPTSNESRVPHRGLPDAKADGRKRGLVVASGRKSLSCADQERRLDTSPPGSRPTAPPAGDAA